MYRFAKIKTGGGDGTESPLPPRHSLGKIPPLSPPFLSLRDVRPPPPHLKKTKRKRASTSLAFAAAFAAFARRDKKEEKGREQRERGREGGGATVWGNPSEEAQHQGLSSRRAPVCICQVFGGVLLHFVESGKSKKNINLLIKGRRQRKKAILFRRSFRTVFGTFIPPFLARERKRTDSTLSFPAERKSEDWCKKTSSL